MSKKVKEGWKKVRLGELGEFKNGVNFSREFKGQGIRLINVKDIFKGGRTIDFGSLDYVDLGDMRGIEKYFVQKNDIFFVRSSVKRDGIGLVSLAKRSDNETIHCGFVIRFRPLNLNVDSLFLTYLLRSPYYRQTLIGLSGGSAIVNISQDTLASLTLTLPPLYVQRKIASILSAYDDLIENNLRRIKILEEMAQMIYREWFVHFRFPGHEKVRMVKSELGMIPEGWEVRRLATLVETQYGYTETASDEEIGPKFLRGTDINKNSFIDWSNVPYCQIPESKLQNYRLSVGDIVVIRMADPGKVGIVEKEINAIFASYLVRLKIKSPNFSPYFLFYFLLSDQYQGYITGASTGTTRKSASAGVITDVDVAVPSVDLREMFEEKIVVIRKMLNNLLDRNTNLRQTRDLLLPKLISGEIEVEKIDIKILEENSNV